MSFRHPWKRIISVGRNGPFVILACETGVRFDPTTQIQQSGITFQEPLVDRPWGAKDFRILDSEGYYWRVTSPRPLAHPEDDQSKASSGYQPGDALYDTSAPTDSQSSEDEDGN